MKKQVLRNSKIILMILLTMSLVSSISATWWNDSYLYRTEINISNPTSTDFTDLPIYLEINKSPFMSSDFSDIRFIQGSCGSGLTNELDYEFENYTSTTLYTWVELQSHQASGSSICMYYNNSAVSTTQNAQNTWNSNYGIVYHMEATGQDSTSNNRDRVSTVGSPVQNNSFMAYGLEVDGNDAWSQADMTYWEQEWFIRSHEIVFTTSADVTTRQTLVAEGGGVNGILMYLVNGQLYARWWSESAPVWNGDFHNISIQANTTYYATMAFDEANNYTLYLNDQIAGTNVSPDYINAHSGNGGIMYSNIAKDYHDGSFTGEYFRGIMHEFRTQDIEQGFDEQVMKYNNYLNYSDTISVGSEEELLPEVQIIVNSPSTLALNPIQQNSTEEINITINCVGTSAISCGRITSYIQYNNSPFSNVSTLSSSTPFWTPDSQGLFCDLDGGDSCNFKWDINATGTTNTDHILRVFSSSNRSKLGDLSSENISIRIITGNFISFNQTQYSFTPFTRNTGSQSQNISVVSNFGAHTNVNVNCAAGDCSTITDNWIDGSNVADGTSSSFEFSCDDSQSGLYSALFNVTSNEFNGISEINVTCNVLDEFGPLNITINEPVTQNTNVLQNLSFDFNTTINCTGICGNITAYAVYGGGAFGDGSDGSRTITSLDTIVNNYTYLTGNELTGQTVLSVNDASEFSINDEIMIIQMQNGSGNGIAGQYEYASISSISSNDITVSIPITNNYYSGTFNTGSAQVTQIVRVPQFTDVTINSGASITAPAWNGFSGGIVIFRATGTINTTGYINVSEKGFRGGDCNGCGDSAWGDQGESTLGVGTNTLSNNGIGGGGGFGPTGVNGEPGAGGGHATSGGNGISTNTATGGSTIGSSNLSRIFFGGGAGGGGDNDNLVPFPEFANGGGITMIFGNEIVNANIVSLGTNAIGSAGAAGVSGGGAGGSIWIVGESVDLGTVDVSGGASYDDGDDLGGAGGDGRLRLDYDSLSGNSPVVPAGFSGSLSDFLNAILEVPGSTPLQSLNSNPQSCVVFKDSSCTFNWELNATGEINTTVPIYVYTFSNYSSISPQISLGYNITIADNILPTLMLVSPSNNVKILSNGTQSFIFNVNDNDLTLNASLLIDGILVSSRNCTSGSSCEINYTIGFGISNWSIQVIDSDTNTVSSEVRNITLLRNYSKLFSKAIYFENSNQYRIELLVSEANNSYSSITKLFDFVENSFSSGSFSLIYNYINSTFGPFYNGEYYYFNDTPKFYRNYSVTSTTDYNVEDLFILGGE